MKNCFAEIIAIGDEVLYGQVLNTNAHFLSTELDKIGIKTIRHSTVPDKRRDILAVWKEAEQRADLILITGGLGPTKDDLTKKLLCEYFGCDLVLNKEILAHIEHLLSLRNLKINDLNYGQAEIPTKAQVLHNAIGTAAGMWFEKEEKIFISMPGVPAETKRIFTEQALPKIKSFFQTPVIFHKIIRTINLPESILAKKIEHWEDSLPEHIRLAYLPSMGHVRLRLTATGEDRANLEKEVEQEIEKVLPLIEKNVFGYDQDELDEVIGKILQSQGQTLATAESCTGGFLAHQFTQRAGSSRYFVGGIVAYSNEVKIKALGVKSETIEQYGAVSEQTARQMAENVRKMYGATVGIATTGIAGPDGGRPDKPVGTIWIAYADEKETFAQELRLSQDRTLNINLTTTHVMNLLRLKLLNFK